MPMLKKTITVPDAMEEWIKAQTASGRYPNDSEYIRDLIRRDQERAQAYAELRVLLEEADASGLSERTPDEILEAAKARLTGGHA